MLVTTGPVGLEGLSYVRRCPWAFIRFLGHPKSSRAVAGPVACYIPIPQIKPQSMQGSLLLWQVSQELSMSGVPDITLRGGPSNNGPC